MYDLLSDEPTFPYYQHLRNFNKDGSYNPRGGRTICYLKDADRNVIGIGVAKCSKSDNYCKATGRALAYDRINQKLLSAKLEARNRAAYNQRLAAETQAAEEFLRVQ